MRKTPELAVLSENDFMRERRYFVSYSLEYQPWIRIQRTLFDQISFMRREILLEVERNAKT